MNLNIIDRITETPKRIATTIIFEDDTKWVRLCDGDCGKQMIEDKVTYHPAPNTPVRDAKVIEVTWTAPSAGRCITCGPAPKN